MTAVTYGNRAEWLEARTKSIGASETPALLGLGYAEQSAMTVYESKVNGESGEAMDPRRLERGRLLEDSIGQIVACETGSKVIHNRQHVVHYHDKLPYISATIDADVFKGRTYGLLEIKGVSHWQASDWDDGGLPDRVICQVQQQLACVPDAGFALVMPLINSLDGEVIRVERSEDMISIIETECTHFWEHHVVKQIPPPVDWKPATGRALFRLHPEDNGLAVSLPDSLRGDIVKREEAKDTIKILKTLVDEVDNQLKAAIGSNTYGVCGDLVYSWKTSTREEKAREARTTNVRTLRKIKKLPKGVN